MRRVAVALVLVLSGCVLLAAGCGSSAAGTTTSRSSQPDAARTLYPVSVNGKYGYIDKSGSLVIKPQFDSGGQFSEGLAAVWDKASDKYGYIDTSGTMVIQPQFPIANAFSEGLAAVETGTGQYQVWGFIDKTGRLVIPGQFASVSKFSEGLCWAIIQKEGQDDKTGFIDKTGAWVIKAGQTSRADFSEGVVLTSLGTYSAIIDQKGKVIAQLPAAKFYPGDSGFSEGLAAVEELLPVLPSGPRQGFIDKTGVVVIKPQFDWVAAFTEGLAVAGVKTNGITKYGYIDKTGAWVIKPQFNTAYPFTEGLAVVGTLLPGRSTDLINGCLYSFIDKTGKVVIKLKEGQLPSGTGFSGGVAGFDTYTDAGKVVPDSRTYIDTTGKVIWQGK